MSFWVAGKLGDRDLADAFRSGACALLLAFVEAGCRARLLGRIGASPGEEWTRPPCPGIGAEPAIARCAAAAAFHADAA